LLPKSVQPYLQTIWRPRSPFYFLPLMGLYELSKVWTQIP